MGQHTQTARRAPWLKWLRVAGLGGVGGLLLWLVARQTQWDDFAGRLARIAWLPMLSGIVAFYLPWLWRGLRLWLLLGRQTAPGLTIAATSACEFLGWLLPAGTGYLSLPPVLGRYLGIQLTWGAKALVAVRLFDMVALTATAAVACAWAAGVYPPLRLVGIPSAAVAVLGLVSLIWPDGVGRAALWLWRCVGGPSEGKVGSFVEGALTVRDAPAFRRLVPALAAVSLLIVGSRIAALWLMCEGLGAPLSVGGAAYAWSVTSLLGQVPIQPPGMLGVADAINTGVFASLGWTRQQAAEVALGVRVMVTPFMLLLGGLAWAVLAARHVRPTGPGE